MNAMSPFGTRYPFHPYPTGWFAVGFSDDLAPKTVRPLHYFGQDMVLFRTETGTAVVTDAHCPHLGAHLGYDSWVDGETIVCPFHQWQYGTDGKCVHVPYAKAVPPRAKVKVWPIAERGGMIFVWHDLDGAEPAYELPVFDESRKRPGSGFQKMHDEFGAMHPQDAFENGVDFAHFPGVHGTGKVISGGTIEVREPHRFYSPVRILPPGYDGPTDDMSIGSTVDSEVIGGGLSRVESHTPSAPGVTTIYYVGVTPVNAAQSHYYVHQFMLVDDDCPMTEAQLDRFIALSREHGIKEQWSDGKIWPHKAYVEKPLLSSADGPILKYRDWYKQFHPRVA